MNNSFALFLLLVSSRGPSKKKNLYCVLEKDASCSQYLKWNSKTTCLMAKDFRQKLCCIFNCNYLYISDDPYMFLMSTSSGWTLQDTVGLLIEVLVCNALAQPNS